MNWNHVDFPKSFISGSLEGLWWSFVTMTTVGYVLKMILFGYLLVGILHYFWLIKFIYSSSLFQPLSADFH